MNNTSNIAPSARGSRRQPETSRNAIMAGALVEFAEQGLAGARMDAIAAAAGVNKALLYYYFRSKDELYAAVLDEFFRRLDARIGRALESGASASERLLFYARAHFDVGGRVTVLRPFIPGRDDERGPRGLAPFVSDCGSVHQAHLAAAVFKVLEQGIGGAGEFRAVDPAHSAPTMAANHRLVLRGLAGCPPSSSR